MLAVLKNSLLDEENALPSGFRTAVVEQAVMMVKSWKARPAPDRDNFLKVVIDRIVVQAEDIEIRLRLAAICTNCSGLPQARAFRPQPSFFRLLP